MCATERSSVYISNIGFTFKCCCIKKFNRFILSQRCFDLSALTSVLASRVNTARSLFNLFIRPPLRFGLVTFGILGSSSLVFFCCRSRYSAIVIGRGPAVSFSRAFSRVSFGILLSGWLMFSYLSGLIKFSESIFAAFNSFFTGCGSSSAFSVKSCHGCFFAFGVVVGMQNVFAMYDGLLFICQFWWLMSS